MGVPATTLIHRCVLHLGCDWSFASMYWTACSAYRYPRNHFWLAFEHVASSRRPRELDVCKVRPRGSPATTESFMMSLARGIAINAKCASVRVQGTATPRKWCLRTASCYGSKSCGMNLSTCHCRGFASSRLSSLGLRGFGSSGLRFLYPKEGMFARDWSGFQRALTEKCGVTWLVRWSPHET